MGRTTHSGGTHPGSGSRVKKFRNPKSNTQYPVELRRIFIPTWAWQVPEEVLVVYGDAVRRMRKVLRLHPEREVILIPGNGTAIHARLMAFTGTQEARFRVIDIRTDTTASAVDLRLAVGWLKHDVLDDAIFHGVQLGVGHFVPLRTRRTVVQPRMDRWERRVRRWLKIAAEALESSGRLRLPTIHPPMTLTEFLSGMPPASPILVLVEPRHPHVEVVPLWAWVDTLRASPREKRLTGLAVVVGPEGGWDPEEIAVLVDHDQVVLCHLGPWTLRSVTAVVAALAIVQPILYDEHPGDALPPATRDPTPDT